MPKYRITDPAVTAVSLAGHEYRVRDGLLIIPDDEQAAIDATAHIGLRPLEPQKPGPAR